MIDHLQTVTKETLEARAAELLGHGRRFVTVTCCNNRDGSFDLFYSFDRDLTLENLKLTVQKDETVPSISGVCLAAAFAENEIGELFGLKFSGLVLDYGGRFLLSEDAPQEPFGKGLIIERKDPQKNA